jgi:putative ABC transport system ATP-binding protein
MSSDLLTADNLVYRHPGSGAGPGVLQDVSLGLRQGEILGLEGPSGCGKSTLLWLLARMLPLGSGRLQLNGRPAEEISPTEWRRGVGLALQKPVMVTGTVRDNLLLPHQLRCRRELSGSDEEGLSDAGLQEGLRELGLDEIELERDSSLLSVGEAARISFLRSLLAAPHCLLLDEPTASLDQDSAAKLAGRLARFVSSGGTALVVQHGRNDIPVGRKLRLEAGRLRELS